MMITNVVEHPSPPHSLLDPVDALTIAYFVRHALKSAQNNVVDSAIFLHSDQLPPEDNPLGETFVEMFVQTYVLREYIGELQPLQPRFMILLGKNYSSTAMMRFDTLEDAIKALLKLDYMLMIDSTWDKFFKT